jgi:hypothetical protein
MKSLPWYSAFTLALLAQSPAQTEGWTRVTPEGGGYAVMFPAAVSSKTQDVDTATGKVHQEIHFCRQGGALFTFQRLGLEFAVPSAQAPNFLAAQKKAYLPEGTRLLGERKLQPAGMLGEEFDYQGRAPRGQGQVRSRTRHYLAGKAYYSLTVSSSPNKPLPSNAGVFLDSLVLDKSADAVGSSGSAPAKTGGQAAGRMKLDDETPEDAFRTFMVAVLTHDEATLREIALPADGFEWLLSGQAAPASAAAAMKEQLARQPIRRLKAGERINLPRGRTMAVGAEEVGPDRAVLLPEGEPIPTRLQKVQGHWKVDARPIIAGRKAADAARRKAQSKQAVPRG